jgi:hypothetical protein
MSQPTCGAGLQANVEGLVRLAAVYESPLLLATCQEWLASAATQLSTSCSSPAHVWRWLVIADRLGMALLVDRWAGRTAACDINCIRCGCVSSGALQYTVTLQG